MATQRKAKSVKRKGNAFLHASRFTLSAVSGFTLIELLIVVTIMGILLGLGIPSYSNFNNRQKLEQSGQNMYQALRLLQNKALAGDQATKCTGGRIFRGWVMHVHIDDPTYGTYALCSASNGTDEQLVDHDDTIPYLASNIINAEVASNPSADYDARGLFLLFRPLAKGISVYNDDPPLTTANEVANIQWVEITLSNVSEIYVVTVLPNGAIHANQ